MAMFVDWVEVETKTLSALADHNFDKSEMMQPQSNQCSDLDLPALEYGIIGAVYDIG